MSTSTTTHGFYPCIFAWTVEIPFEGRDRRSNSFSYKGHKVHLRWFFNKNDIYSVELHAPPSFPSCDTSQMTVRVETKDKSQLSLPNIYRIAPPEHKIFWQYSRECILSEYPDFLNHGVLTFLVSDVDPPNQGIIADVPKEEKSVQASVILPPDEPLPKEEKSVQASLILPPDEPLPKEEKFVQTSEYLNDVSCLEDLSTDFSRLLQNRDQVSPPDVELLCDYQTVQVHGPVLSARSQVFSRMLQSVAPEGRNVQVKLKNVEVSVFDQFVLYLYSGKLSGDLNVDTAKCLYEAADKYKVSCLMRRCATFLKENLTPDNACEILVLADANNDKDFQKIFKEIVADFIVKQEIPLHDDQWLPFCESHPKLGFEVFSRFCKFQRNKWSAIKKLAMD